LTIIYNGEKYFSDNGLKDLLDENIAIEDMVYPIIHLKEMI
jgi:topoisomerase-4 subunit B